MQPVCKGPASRWKAHSPKKKNSQPSLAVHDSRWRRPPHARVYPHAQVPAHPKACRHQRPTPPPARRRAYTKHRPYTVQTHTLSPRATPPPPPPEDRRTLPSPHTTSSTTRRRSRNRCGTFRRRRSRTPITPRAKASISTLGTLGKTLCRTTPGHNRLCRFILFRSPFTSFFPLSLRFLFLFLFDFQAISFSFLLFPCFRCSHRFFPALICSITCVTPSHATPSTPPRNCSRFVITNETKY